MTDKKQLRFITGNVHKFKEVKQFIIQKFPEFNIMKVDLPLQEIQAETLEEVAEFKVQSVKEKIEAPYFIEDAGFFVDDVCLGFPGVYSSYVMKTIGYKGILKIMQGAIERSAHFESVIAYMKTDGEIVLFKGVNQGKVSHDARGSSGFGFDPIFVSDDYPERTFAQLTTEQKNRVSHRRRSLEKLIAWLRNQNY